MCQRSNGIANMANTLIKTFTASALQYNGTEQILDIYNALEDVDRNKIFAKTAMKRCIVAL